MIPGDVLGSKYELESRLGKGGMGEVWRARHLITNERVAVKVLLADLAQDAVLQKRFLREARAAAAVKHPNVVELRDVQESDDGSPFLVMELLTGETLGRRLRRKGMLSVAEVAAIFLPVFDAVEAAHAAGLVHRDLKPENIFLARDEGAAAAVRVRVLDFGIAKKVEKLATPATSSAAATAPAETTAAMLGTPYYMAPEQALGERDIDGRADIWSLGVVIYECLSGRRPTEAATLGAILKIIVTDGVVPIQTVLPEIDGPLADALMQMLRSGRDQRSPSLDAMRERLAALRDPGYELETETDEGIPASAQRSNPAAIEHVRERGLERRPTRRLPWLVGLGALAVGTALLVRSNGGPSGKQMTATASPAAPSSVGTAAASAAVPAPSAAVSVSASAAVSASTAASAPGAATPTITRSRRDAGVAAPVVVSAAPGAGGVPSRGPSGLVTDNPFGAPR
ncbi:MAG TPA: serine/threonine-protein kinase [Labilithrix sp.]|nr:serine/threonine-protein kinase [Labilithrix sp.]